MKTHLPETLQAPGGPVRKDRRGVALITVLTFVALTTILMMTFFLMAQNEHKASLTYSEGLQAQEVAESAVNLVIHQIRAATSQPNKAWASQPGAIRTWGTEEQFEGYKLYSDETMVFKGSATAEKDFAKDDFTDLRSWTTKPNSFVDLNEPVIRGDKVYYPIVDPLAKTEPKWRKAIGGDDNGVEGFDYTNDVALSDFDKEVKIQTSRDTLPMPVRWIYQLRDGTLGYLNNADKFAVLTPGGATPSVTNPIVARFAFWADDETCKLNPNVHAGGATWNSPIAGGDIDRNDGGKQPLRGEYQRYNGHPATTHLSPVLIPGVTNITNDRQAIAKLFDIVPRLVGGGSDFGTKAYDTNANDDISLKKDTDRLYASLDEFLFKNDPDEKKERSMNEFPTAGGMIGTAGTRSVKDTLDLLERTRFFLTVNSRSPETNILNLPRISMWPTYRYQGTGDIVYLTPFDSLIRFCSELGGTPGSKYKYYFEREKADDAVWDYEYIERNQQLYAYLTRLTETDIPGYGGNFKAKFGDENRMQLLTQIFDYIRSTNLSDDSLFMAKTFDAAFSGVNRPDWVTYTNPRATRQNNSEFPGYGQVTPIEIPTDTGITKGFGRFFTLSDLGVVVITCAQSGGEPGGSYPSILDPGFVDETHSPARVKQASTPATAALAHFSNFPPLPLSVQKDNEASWPSWLQTVKATAPEMVESAFDENKWNWMLAWLDPAYAAGMRSNAASTLYNRAVLSGDGSQMRLNPGESLCQAGLFFQMAGLSPGYVPIIPDFEMEVTINGMEFTGSAGPTTFIKPSETDVAGSFLPWHNSGERGHIYNPVGNALGYRYFMGRRVTSGSKGAPPVDMSKSGFPEGGPGISLTGRVCPLDSSFASSSTRASDKYYFVTPPFKIGVAGGQPLDQMVTMASGEVKVDVYTAGNELPEAQREMKGNYASAPQGARSLVQSAKIKFPGFSAKVPKLAQPRAGGWEMSGAQPYRGRLGAMVNWSLGHDGPNPNTARFGRMAAIASTHSATPWVRIEGAVTNLDTNDLVRAMGVEHGDVRLAAIRKTMDSDADEIFVPSHDYDKSDVKVAAFGLGNGEQDRRIVPGANYSAVPARAYATSLVQLQRTGDFDSGIGEIADGAYINKPDEGNMQFVFDKGTPSIYGNIAYFSESWNHDSVTPSYFSPNRIVCSPMAFGSLPSMPLSGRTSGGGGVPWQTLLFRPNVTGGIYSSHKGAQDPPDHLIADLFWMPVVEPYAISEPLSTAGKVNLNYQIAPFNHIKRTSALRGVFKSEYMVVIPKEWESSYKAGHGYGAGWHYRDNPYGGTLTGVSLRAVIHADGTLEQFDRRFETGLFRAASEICEIHLVPISIGEIQGAGRDNGIRTPHYNQMANGTYWSINRVTGDNAREKAYNNIYPRITTKSNTFKVHYRAQVLRKAKVTAVDAFDPEVDQVVSEYRGSSVIERFVEPSDPNLPDFATVTDLENQSIDRFYKFRILNPARFAP